MTNRAVLIKEIDSLPPVYINEVIDFVGWIKQRRIKNELSQIPETILLSEASLAKDWNTPEEDEAWASL